MNNNGGCINKNNGFEISIMGEDYIRSNHNERVESDNESKQYIVGNSVNFLVNESDCEIKADVVVKIKESTRVWGQVKDCEGNVISYAYVKLLKKTPNGFTGVAHTITDCKGFYQFDLENCIYNEEYTIIAGKAALGNERVIIPRNNKCEGCNNFKCYFNQQNRNCGEVLNEY